MLCADTSPVGRHLGTTLTNMSVPIRLKKRAAGSLTNWSSGTKAQRPTTNRQREPSLDIFRMPILAAETPRIGLPWPLQKWRQGHNIRIQTRRASNRKENE